MESTRKGLDHIYLGYELSQAMCRKEGIRRTIFDEKVFLLEFFFLILRLIYKITGETIRLLHKLNIPTKKWEPTCLNPFPKPHIMERYKAGLDKSCTPHFKLFIKGWDLDLPMEDTMLLSCWIPIMAPRNSSHRYQQWLCSAIHLKRDFSGGQSTQSTSCCQH